jgi:FkbM family methyltransferase
MTNENSLLKIAHNVLPLGMKRLLFRSKNVVSEWPKALQLGRLRYRIDSGRCRANKIERLWHYTVRINDGPNFYAIYKDIFVKRIYHFDAQRPDPFILDCGSNIGGAILYFKHVYPQARIIGFEPDPAIFPYLRENIARNKLNDVQLVQAALRGREGTAPFYSDGKSGSRIANEFSENMPHGWAKYEVNCVHLRDYLTEPVDFLKMNIEGAEWDVLADSEDQLRKVREMVIEYHYLPGLPRMLHKILELLHRQGFEYLINDFDYETNPGLRPPFRLTPDSRYFLLIYANRLD